MSDVSVRQPASTTPHRQNYRTTVTSARPGGAVERGPDRVGCVGYVAHVAWSTLTATDVRAVRPRPREGEPRAGAAGRVTVSFNGNGAACK